MNSELHILKKSFYFISIQFRRAKTQNIKDGFFSNVVQGGVQYVCVIEGTRQMSSELFGTFHSILSRAPLGESGLAALSAPQGVGHTILSG